MQNVQTEGAVLDAHQNRIQCLQNDRNGRKFDAREGRSFGVDVETNMNSERER